MGVSRGYQYVTLEELVPKVQEVIRVYRNEVLDAIADTMDDNAKDFITEVKKVSPPNDGPGIGGHYRDSWAVRRMRKAKFVRYIGNTKKVKAHYRDEEPTIPLINILEFSPNPHKKRLHVGKALDNSADQIINRIVSHIQKVGK